MIRNEIGEVEGSQITPGMVSHMRILTFIPRMVWNYLTVKGGETELEIIKLRYFNPIPWDNVSSKVGYSKGHCKSLRVKAIDKIKSLI